MARFLFIGGFGFLPLWATIAFVYVGGRQSTSSDYWNVAPWFVLYAVPFCGVTVGMALATIAVFSASSGDTVRRTGLALATFASLCALVGAAGWGYWLHREQVQVDLAAEESQVLEFVRTHQAVVSAAGSNLKVGMSSKSIVNDRPVKYDVAVFGPYTVYAIVKVERSDSSPSFSLLCVTSRSLGQRDPHKSECAQ